MGVGRAWKTAGNKAWKAGRSHAPRARGGFGGAAGAPHKVEMSDIGSIDRSLIGTPATLLGLIVPGDPGSMADYMPTACCKLRAGGR